MIALLLIGPVAVAMVVVLWAWPSEPAGMDRSHRRLGEGIKRTGGAR